MPARPSHAPANLAAQYGSADPLRVRVETHARYTVGPEIEPAVDERLALRGDEDLLDVGTGTGAFPGRISDMGHRGRLVGVDASAGMVREARLRHPAVTFLQADSQHLPFADGNFDVVTARHMLYHVPDAARAIREARRVLRSGGRFLAVTNAGGYMSEYREALSEAAGSLPEGVRKRVVAASADAFDEHSGAAMIRAVFGAVEVTLLDSALVFDRAEPVLRYFDSTRSMRDVPEAAWAQVRSALVGVLAARLRGGPWRVSKRNVLLSAVRG